jgi:hypothetical protein
MDIDKTLRCNVGVSPWGDFMMARGRKAAGHEPGASLCTSLETAGASLCTELSPKESEPPKSPARNNSVHKEAPTVSSEDADIELAADDSLASGIELALTARSHGARSFWGDLAR